MDSVDGKSDVQAPSNDDCTEMKYKRERNRKSAQRSRAKTKLEQNTFRLELEHTRNENNVLREEIKRLRLLLDIYDQKGRMEQTSDKVSRSSEDCEWYACNDMTSEWDVSEIFK